MMTGVGGGGGGGGVVVTSSLCGYGRSECATHREVLYSR